MVAFLLGPNIRKPFLLNSSTIPFDKANSGPTTVKSIFSFWAKSTNFAILSASIFIH